MANTPERARTTYDCSKCPAYCCSIYGRVEVTDLDLKRLAKHLGLTTQVAEKRHTKFYGEERILRRRKDALLGESCAFLHPETRGCTVYEGRPKACRDYPGRPRCVYYDVLQFEKSTQEEDDDVLPLFQITFRK